MSSIEIKNAEGTTVQTVDLADRVYGIEPNIPVVHQVVTCYLASLRQGTHAVKGRSQVSGGGRKPWRQKGTGRARQGSIRAAQWAGGGVVFGPVPRSHARRVNNKEAKLAMRSVLSGKLADNELYVVDEISFDKPSTKAALALLQGLGIAEKRVTVVVPDDAIEAFLSFRNLPRVTCIGASEANTHFLIDNAALVMPLEIAVNFGEVLA
jgi:large subunit ribosomal protein L4